MSALHVDVDPSEAGLDADRLARIGAHFRQYTDDGRMAGWLAGSRQPRRQDRTSRDLRAARRDRGADRG
jgi:hypothetical protein